jgi:elongation factor G
MNDIPEKYREEAELRRAELLDAISVASDEMTELVLEGKPVPVRTDQGCRRSARGRWRTLFTPGPLRIVSKMYQGVQQLLDLVVDCLPSPLDRPPVEGLHPKTKDVVTRRADPKEPMSALAFKTVAESTGDLVYIRVYSGVMKPGETYLNTTINRTERVVRFYRMMGDKRIELEQAGPGDIVAAIGLKQTFTGQTLCDQEHPVALEAISFPKPVVSSALTFAKSLDSGKVGEALSRLVRDDPTLKQHTDEETKETILSGMGELHLEISMEKLRRALNIPQSDPQIQLGKPRVAYRQSFSRAVDLEYQFKKQTGGRGKYAVICVRSTNRCRRRRSRPRSRRSRNSRIRRSSRTRTMSTS